MAKITIKRGSAIIEFWDDSNPPKVFVTQFQDAHIKQNNTLIVERQRKKGGGQPEWEPDTGHGGIVGKP